MRVLLLEPDLGVATDVRGALAAHTAAVSIEHVQTLAAAERRAGGPGLDAAIVDMSLQEVGSFEALARIRRAAPHLPIVALTGPTDERFAEKIVLAGAQDYLGRDRIDGDMLHRVLRYACERKRSEQYLRESVERFRALVDNSAVGVALLAADLTITYHSRAVERVLGLRPEERVGRSALERIHPADRPRVELFGRDVVARPGAVGHEVCRMWHTTLGWREVEITATNRLLEPAVNAIVVNYRDVTDERRAAAELRVQEGWLRSLIQTSPAGILVVDRQGRIQLWNPAAERIYGWREDEVIGRPVPFIPEAEADSGEDIHERVLRGATLENIELRRMRRDGALVRLLTSVAPLRNDAGEIAGALFVERDVTERNRALAAARQGDQRVRTLLEGVDDHAMLLLEPDGTIAACNQAVRHVLGFSPEQLVGEPLATLYPEGDAEIAGRDLRHAAVERYPFEGWRRRRDGGVILASGVLNAVRDGDVVRSYSLLFRDVTQARRIDRLARAQYEVGRALFTDDESQALSLALRAIGEALDAQSGLAWIANGHGPTVRAAWTLDGEAAATPDRPGQAVENAWHTAAVAMGAGSLGEASAFVFPLVGASGVVGAIELACAAPPTIDPELLRALANVSHQLGQYLERRRAERGAREVELRNAAIVAHALDCIITSDADDVITEFNPAAERVFGWTREEVVGKQRLEILVPPELHARHRADLQRLNAGGEALVRRGEYDALRRDGTRFPVEVSLAVAGSRETPIYTTYLRDITDRTRIESALRESEAHFRLLIENSADLIVCVDGDGVLKYVSPSVEHKFGYRAAEVLGRPLLEFVHPDDQLLVAARFRAAYQGDDSGRLDARLRDRFGAWHVVEAKGTRIPGRTGEAELVINAWDVTERRRTEEALRASEFAQRQLVESVQAIVWRADADPFRFTFVSNESMAMLGYPPAEWLEDPGFWSEHIHPEDRPVLAECQEAIAERRSYALEYRMIAADGHAVWLHDLVKPVTQPDGSIELVGVMVDISDRKRAEQRLQFLAAASTSLVGPVDLSTSLTSVAYLAVAHVATYCSVLLLDEAGGLSRVAVAHHDNATSELMAEVAPRREPRFPVGLIEVLESRRTRILRNPSRELLRELVADRRYADLLADEGFETLLLVPLVMGSRPLGAIAIGAASPHPGFLEADLALFGDLAQRAALAVDNARLEKEARELFDDDLTGKIVTTRRGDLVVWNHAFASMLGLTEGSATPSMRELLGEARRWDALVATVEERGSVRHEEIALNWGGRSTVALVNLTAVRSQRGELTRVRGHLYDVSERKQLEARFQQAQKMEAVGRLAGGIAHDFNNLLTVILGQTEKLQGRVNGDAAAGLAAVHRSAERAAALTQQLLAFSRRQVLAPKVLALDRIVTGTHSLLRRLIGEDIDIDIGSEAGLWSVQADPGSLEQVIMNLAVNARDAMPDGGRLSISTSNVVLDEAYARQHVSAKPGEYVMLAVSDTGCGMTEEIKAHLFEPFFTTKPSGKGTGLGLSTVYGIVKQNGGWIYAYSEVGAGTTFKIYLPRVVASADTQTDVSPKVPPVPKGHERILLVEDESSVRELLHEVLCGLGYGVIEARDGVEALELSAREPRIDLLVTDVIMPQMNGRELAEQLALMRGPMRVLYLSGYTDDAVFERGLVQAGSSFLQKPFSTARLAMKIRELLDLPPSSAS